MPTPQSIEPPARSGGLSRSIGVNAVLPYVTYVLLTRYGVATVPALAAGAVFPATTTLFGMLWAGRIEALGIIVLAATGTSVASALWFTSPYLALAKGSLITGVIGLVFLISLVLKRPLVFYLAAAGMDQAATRRNDALWDARPGYRHLMRKLTAIWAIALLAEATLRLLLIPLFPIAIFLPISEIMWIGFFATMTAWSWRYGKRMRARMMAEAAEPGRPAGGPECLGA
jgi:hypothetical protein